MVKHKQVTIIVMGDGTTLVMGGANTKGEGLINLFHSDKLVGEPGTAQPDLPSDVDPEFPDVTLLFRTTSDIDRFISNLNNIKNCMIEANKPVEGLAQEEPGFFDKVKATLKSVFKKGE